MTVVRILDMVGLLSTTIGAILIMLYLWKSPRFAEDWLTDEGKRAYVKHRLLLIVSVGLLVVWLVIQYLAFILI